MTAIRKSTSAPAHSSLAHPQTKESCFKQASAFITNNATKQTLLDEYRGFIKKSPLCREAGTIQAFVLYQQGTQAELTTVMCINNPTSADRSTRMVAAQTLYDALKQMINTRLGSTAALENNDNAPARAVGYVFNPKLSQCTEVLDMTKTPSGQITTQQDTAPVLPADHSVRPQN